MLIRKYDAAISEDEWKAFLGSRDFGELIASGRGRDVPVVVPIIGRAFFGLDGAAELAFGPS